MTHLSARALLISGGVLFIVGCSSDTEATAPNATLSQGLVKTPLVPVTFAAMRNGNQPSRFQCNVIARQPDGTYKKAVMWLNFPSTTLDPAGATEIARFEWRTDSAGPRLAAASCKLPKTPQATDHLLNRILFIDPKTLRGNSRGSGLSTSRIPTATGQPNFARDTQYIAGMTVWASPNNWTGGSGGSTRSVNYGDSSINRWDTVPGDGYWSEGVWPDEPCGDGGVGVDEPNSSLEHIWAEEVCPQTEYGSICIDIYISRCSVGGLEGDCRGSDMNAPASASRAQIVIPTDFSNANLARTYIHESCITNSVICVAPLDAPDNRVSIAYIGENKDTIAVSLSLSNSITSLGGRIPTPAIDAQIILVRNSWGGWTSPAGNRDAFPSMDIIHHEGPYGGYYIQQREETTPLALIDRLNLRDRWALCVER